MGRNWLLQFLSWGKTWARLVKPVPSLPMDLELADKIRVLRDHGPDPEIPSCRGRLELPNGCNSGRMSCNQVAIP